jgi:hypothetical protein
LELLSKLMRVPSSWYQTLFDILAIVYRINNLFLFLKSKKEIHETYQTEFDIKNKNTAVSVKQEYQVS